MGRWAQRRLRSTQGVGPVLPPAGITLNSVVAIGPTTYRLTFSAAITYDFSADLDFFTVDGVPPDVSSVTSPTSTTLTCEYAGGAAAGGTWLLSAQPSQITEAIVVPVSGLTT